MALVLHLQSCQGQHVRRDAKGPECSKIPAGGQLKGLCRKCRENANVDETLRLWRDVDLALMWIADLAFMRSTALEMKHALKCAVERRRRSHDRPGSGASNAGRLGAVHYSLG